METRPARIQSDMHIHVLRFYFVACAFFPGRAIHIMLKVPQFNREFNLPHRLPDPQSSTSVLKTPSFNYVIQKVCFQADFFFFSNFSSYDRIFMENPQSCVKLLITWGKN